MPSEPLRLADDQLQELAERVAAAAAREERPRLVDAVAAGELLGVPKTWLLAEARKDAVPWVPVGRYVRFDPVELEAWWQARLRGPRAPRAGSGPVPLRRDAA